MTLGTENNSNIENFHRTQDLNFRVDPSPNAHTTKNYGNLHSKFPNSKPASISKQREGRLVNSSQHPFQVTRNRFLDSKIKNST